MSDTHLQDIQDQLRQLKQCQCILAVMICVFGVCSLANFYFHGLLEQR